MPFLFRREYRLRKQFEFQRVFDEGRRYQTGPFSLIATPNDLSHSRLGLVVSRKVGSAPQRNLIKRRFREIFRLSHQNWPCHCDFVVVVRPSAKKSSYQELDSSLQKAVLTLTRNTHKSSQTFS